MTLNGQVRPVPDMHGKMFEGDLPRGLAFSRLDELAVVQVDVRSLHLDISLRHDGEDHERVRKLAEVEVPLPPIMIHEPSLSVLDGHHRVRAALLRGDDMVSASLHPGPIADAFVLAVLLNMHRGTPLTRTDRTAAAARMINFYPQWSDRMIAEITGVAASTVRQIRKRSTRQHAGSTRRIGRDGRTRPTNGAAGRRRVAELFAEQPDAPIRKIAVEAGVSPSTVHDVRRRLLAGENVIPAHLLEAAESARRKRHPHQVPQLPDTSELLAMLMKDPSLRSNEPGRLLLRWLTAQQSRVEHLQTLLAAIPTHCVAAVAKVMRGQASVWMEFATQLEERSSGDAT